MTTYDDPFRFLQMLFQDLPSKTQRPETILQNFFSCLDNFIFRDLPCPKSKLTEKYFPASFFILGKITGGAVKFSNTKMFFSTNRHNFL